MYWLIPATVSFFKNQLRLTPTRRHGRLPMFGLCCHKRALLIRTEAAANPKISTYFAPIRHISPILLQIAHRRISFMKHHIYPRLAALIKLTYSPTLRNAPLTHHIDVHLVYSSKLSPSASALVARRRDPRGEKQSNIWRPLVGFTNRRKWAGRGESTPRNCDGTTSRWSTTLKLSVYHPVETHFTVDFEAPALSKSSTMVSGGERASYSVSIGREPRRGIQLNNINYTLIQYVDATRESIKLNLSDVRKIIDDFVIYPELMWSFLPPLGRFLLFCSCCVCYLCLSAL